MSEAEAKTEEPAAPKPASEGRGPRRGPRGEKTCYNCGQSGHIARDCENPRLEGDARQVINKARAQYRRCFNCGKMGHISADCTKPAGNKACYNCGQEGHIAKDCPSAKSEQGRPPKSVHVQCVGRAIGNKKLSDAVKKLL